MSKLTEYLKLIPSGVKNLPQIVEALTNQVKIELGTIPQEDLEVIVGRRAICKTCPFMSVNAQHLGVYTTSRTDEHCIHCGCPTSTRTASLDSNCGIEDFNLENPDTPLNLKWEKTK
jgi:hypothetical protein